MNMSNTPNDETEVEKKERVMVAARKIWMFLTPLFALIALFSFYNWTQGSSPSGVFSPIGMMFIGLSMIVGKRNKTLSYILLAVAIIFVIAGLIRVIMDFMD
jgi:hypothetical protein